MSSDVIKDLTSGESWVKKNKPKWCRAGLVLLSGAMGAGKTQVAQWMLHELGVRGGASPTFAIHHNYLSSFFPIDHFDLYRLSRDIELEEIGFWDTLAREDNLVIVEWSDRLPSEVYPASRPKLWLNIVPQPNGDRVYNWSE